MSKPEQAFAMAEEAYARKELTEAESLCRSALHGDSTYTPALELLSRVLIETGRPRDGVALLQQWVSRQPASASAHHHLGLALAALGRPEEALFRFRHAASLKPDWADPLVEAGRLLAALGRLSEAEKILRVALERDGDSTEAHHGLGTVLCGLERHEEALQHLGRVPAANPGYDDAQIKLGNALFALFRGEEALVVFQALCREKPLLAAAHVGAGNALRTLGRLAEARESFRTALDLAPDTPALHRAVADGKVFRPADPQLSAMEELARHPGRFSVREQVELHFALAKAYHDLGDVDRSFDHLRQGGALKRSITHYDEAAMLGHLERIAGAFSADLLRARAGQGHAADVPVFVVGMPRSGTTLVEQILASHPQVIAMGEQRHLSDLIEEGRAGADFPAAIGSLPAEAFADFGAAYLQRLPSGARRVTDKLPANFRHIGLIRLALPNARIIHVRRDPMDTCFSCYRHLFVNGLEYTNDLGELGRYYRAYRSLMAHWRQVLPPGVMLEIDYEELVQDLEGNARRLIAYCGLEWDANCLSFHRTERPIYTASVDQVRTPLYDSSVGIWHGYEKHLAPLKAELGEG